MKALLALAVALLTLPAAAAAKAPTGHADVLIRHATIIDVAAGQVRPGQAVATVGERIVAVGDDAAMAKQWRARHTIDAGKRYLMPGLWDMHVHFGGGPDLIAENRALLPLYIANGITTVRDASGDLGEQVLQWRGEIASGALPGPRLFSSGPKIEGIDPVWKGTIEVGSQADVNRAITRLQALHVDFVKITDSTLKPELFLYAVERARAAGLRASGHIPQALTVEQAVDAGLSSIEHLDYAWNLGVPDEAAIAADFAAGRISRAEAGARLNAGFNPETAARAYRDLAARGLAVTPTLFVSTTIAGLATADHSQDPELAYIGPRLRETYNWRIERAKKQTAEETAARAAHVAALAALLPMLRDAGVPILAGTDAGFLNSFDYPGFSLHEELALYVKSGLSPAQALATATLTGPAWFGLGDQYGAVEAGRMADLLLLDANPLADIAATKSTHMVVLRGKVIDRAALDHMLADVRAKVAAWNREAADSKTAEQARLDGGRQRVRGATSAAAGGAP